MKKITLALCACAFALTGLLASCSSEASSVNYVDNSSYNSNYKYAVKGTIKTTSENGIKTSSNGTTPDKNGKFTGSAATTEEKINGGFVTVSWSTNENREANYTNYSINGSVPYTSTETVTNTVYGEKASGSKRVNSGSTYLGWSISEINGDYYIIENGSAAKKIEEYAISEDDDAFDGDFGGEFTLYLKYNEDQTWEDYAGYDFAYTGDLKDNDDYKDYKALPEYGYKETRTVEYKLTFYPLEDFDPEEEIEDEE